jgi:hypothetical protein
MNFDVFFKKTLCLGKMAITFAYEVGLKSFLYEKVSTRKVFAAMQLTETRRESQASYAHPPANQAKRFSRLSMSTTRISCIY